MSAWSHLPNAKHIDRILASVKENPAAWDAARGAVWGAALDAVRGAVWDAALGYPVPTARGAVWDAALDAALAAARDAVLDAARRWARGAVWGAVLALVTYDHAAKYLEMTPDQLRVWAELSEDPAAVLLISAVRAFESLGTMYPTDVAS